MGDDKAGPAFHELVHGLLDRHLGSGVHGGGRLVENQDFRIRQEGPGDGQKLPLPLGDVGSALVELHVVAAGHSHDKSVGVGGLGGLHHLLVAGVKLTVADIVPDGAGEQPGVLQYHSDHGAEGFAVHVPHVDTVYGDASALHVVKTQNQIDQRGFTGSGGPHNGDLVSGTHMEIQVMDQQPVVGVSELYMVEVHISLRLFGEFLCLDLGHLFLGIQEFKDSLGRRHGRLHDVGDVGNLVDGLGKLAQILDKGLDHADGEPAVYAEPPADHRHAHIADVGQRLGQRHDNAG